VAVYICYAVRMAEGEAACAKVPDSSESLLAVDGVIAKRGAGFKPPEVDFRNVHAAEDRVNQKDLTRRLPCGTPLPSGVEVDSVSVSKQLGDRPASLLHFHE
jgi:hypothetical protein